MTDPPEMSAMAKMFWELLVYVAVAVLLIFMYTHPSSEPTQQVCNPKACVTVTQPAAGHPK